MSDGKDVVVSGSLEERVTEKLKADIGNLMTEEELKVIFDKCTENIFFKPRLSHKDYGKEHMTENAEKYQEMIKEACNRGIEDLFFTSFGRVFKTGLQEAENAMTNQLFTVMQSHRTNDHGIG